MKKEIKMVLMGLVCLIMFVIWTFLIQNVDVQAIGPKNTQVGFAGVNAFVHAYTGVHMNLYMITDYMGIFPILICFMFGCIGCIQWILRKSIFKVDKELIVLGVYYCIVIACFIVFEMYPINYRPILIENRLEASYPSSTTLLVLSVIPTCIFYVKQHMKKGFLQKGICIVCILFILFMILGRLISGVHWFTDIVGSILFSIGLFQVYKGIVLLYCK